MKRNRLIQELANLGLHGQFRINQKVKPPFEFLLDSPARVVHHDFISDLGDIDRIRKLVVLNALSVQCVLDVIHALLRV